MHIYVPKGKSLTITTPATIAGYYRLEVSPGITQNSNKTIAANTSVTIGPFDGDVTYAVMPNKCTYSVQDAATQIPAGTKFGGTTLTPTATELNYLSGVTSAIQTQLNNAASGAHGTLKSFQILTTGAAATYTKPAGVVSLLVEVCGAGGGGGGVAATSGSASAAGGGGGGSYGRIWLATAAATYTYYVGTGGAGGTAGNNNGSSGTSTSFGGVTAGAGAGGVGDAGALISAAGVELGGLGGNITTGDFCCPGQPGNPGLSILGAMASGNGGGSFFGGGGQGVNTAAAGNAPSSAYGGGGSGAATGTSTNRAGGAGAGGLIVVWEYS